jgi:hypothetical protein
MPYLDDPIFDIMVVLAAVSSSLFLLWVGTAGPMWPL